MTSMSIWASLRQPPPEWLCLPQVRRVTVATSVGDHFEGPFAAPNLDKVFVQASQLLDKREH